MDRTSRILVGWIVSCLIAGGALIVANVPVGSELWTDQAVLLVRLGLFAVALGIIGLVGEVALVLASFRRRMPASVPVALGAPAIADSPEIEQMREELAKRQEDERRKELDRAKVEFMTFRQRLSNMSDAERASVQPTSTWADIDMLERNARRWMKPDELAEFDREIDQTKLADPDWVTNATTYLEIKVRRMPGRYP